MDIRLRDRGIECARGQGRIRFTGFLGEYGCTSGEGSAIVTLDQPGPLAVEARLA